MSQYFWILKLGHVAVADAAEEMVADASLTSTSPAQTNSNTERTARLHAMTNSASKSATAS